MSGCGCSKNSSEFSTSFLDYSDLNACISVRSSYMCSHFPFDLRSLVDYELLELIVCTSRDVTILQAFNKIEESVRDGGAKYIETIAVV